MKQSLKVGECISFAQWKGKLMDLNDIIKQLIDSKNINSCDMPLKLLHTFKAIDPCNNTTAYKFISAHFRVKISESKIICSSYYYYICIVVAISINI